MKQLVEKFNFELKHAFNFSCTLNKKTRFCQQNFVTYQHNVPYMVDLFVFSLDIPNTK